MGGERLGKLLCQWGQNWRRLGRSIGYPALLPAMIGSQTQGHHGLVLVCLELFQELKKLRATVGALLVGLGCSRVHGCWYLCADYNRNRGEMAPVCIGAEAC